MFISDSVVTVYIRVLGNTGIAVALISILQVWNAHSVMKSGVKGFLTFPDKSFQFHTFRCK